MRHLTATITGHSNKKSPNWVGQVNNHQHPTMGLQFREHGPEPNFVLRQGGAESLTSAIQRRGVMGTLAHIESAERINLITRDGAPWHCTIRRQRRRPMPHPRYEEIAALNAEPCPY